MENVQIQNSRVLVTGGAGFIGSNLCETLLKQNNFVVCLDNFSTGYWENISEILEHPNFRLIKGDIRNYGDCLDAVDMVEYVLHQAALGSVPRSIKNPMLTNEVNVGGFVNMLMAAKERGIKRFVYASSSAVYGDSKTLPKIEHQIGKQLSPYAISKYTNELYARNFSEIFGIETIGLRYFNVFGRKQDPEGAYAAVIPKFITQMMNNESPVIFGDGSYSRDFTYIDNVVEANQLAALFPTELLLYRLEGYHKMVLESDLKSNSNGTVSEVFNVAHGERLNLNQLGEQLTQNLSEYDKKIANVKICYGENRIGDIPHSLANIQKIEEVLGYYPKHMVREGLRETCHWYWSSLKKQ